MTSVSYWPHPAITLETNMKNNDILRGLRYALNMSDTSVCKMMALTGLQQDKQNIIAMMKKDDEPGFVECSDETLLAYLDGLIIDRRGPAPASAGDATMRQFLDNNVVLRKLRIALELKDDDIMAIMELAGFCASKPEINALFRKPDHKNFRACGDQFLRNFLKGLSLKIRNQD